MLKLIEKLFFQDDPASGALCGTAWFIFGSWSMVNCLMITGCRQYFSAALVILGILFAYLLVTGCRYGWLRRKELTFARRWKWQIPASCCWLIAANGCLGGICIYFEFFPHWFCAEFSRISVFAGAWALLFGFYCTAKIIATAEECDYKNLFGKGVWCILCIWMVTCFAVITGTALF